MRMKNDWSITRILASDWLTLCRLFTQLELYFLFRRIQYDDRKALRTEEGSAIRNTNACLQNVWTWENGGSFHQSVYGHGDSQLWLLPLSPETTIQGYDSFCFRKRVELQQKKREYRKKMLLEKTGMTRRSSLRNSAISIVSDAPMKEHPKNEPLMEKQSEDKLSSSFGNGVLNGQSDRYRIPQAKWVRTNKSGTELVYQAKLLHFGIFY